MKPAFPTVVYWMPNCWKLLAAKSANAAGDAADPEIAALYGMEDTALSEVVDEDSVLRSLPRQKLYLLERFRRKITGTRTAAPIRERTPLKVKGPTYSMPTLWATKAIPQMVAARSRQREFFRGIFCVFMIKESFRLSGIMWSKRYIRKDPGELQIASRGIFMICRNRVRQN